MKHSNFRGATRRFIALTAAAACTGVLAATAGAAEAVVPAAGAPGIPVKYGDLNLASDAGVHALYGRLVRAANQACGVEYSRDLKAMQAAEACRDEAVARAVLAVGSPRLAAVAAARAKAG